VTENGISNKSGEDGKLEPERAKKKRRTGDRGAGSRKNHKRAGNPVRKLERLSRNLQKEGATVGSSQFSIVEDGSAASTGWHGAMPTLNDQKQIDAAYSSGTIREIIANFYPVYYDR
jgi:hypothetical protein